MKDDFSFEKQKQEDGEKYEEGGYSVKRTIGTQTQGRESSTWKMVAANKFKVLEMRSWD